MTMIEARLSQEELTESASTGSELASAIAGFAAAVVNVREVDPLVREMVRLRCAQIHDCRLCGSLRSEEALKGGFDEVMQRDIARYEASDLSPSIKVALRLCDAIILTPGAISRQLKPELRAYFSDAQILSLCLDVMKWSQQKALVALRMEPPVSEFASLLSFDEGGNPVIGGEAYR